jgi:hypothetical protein
MKTRARISDHTTFTMSCFEREAMTGHTKTEIVWYKDVDPNELWRLPSIIDTPEIRAEIKEYHGVRS